PRDTARGRRGAHLRSPRGRPRDVLGARPLARIRHLTRPNDPVPRAGPRERDRRARPPRAAHLRRASRPLRALLGRQRERTDRRRHIQLRGRADQRALAVARRATTSLESFTVAARATQKASTSTL